MHSRRSAQFVTFEGIEGSGKGVQLSLLEKELRRRGLDFTVTRQPGGTGFGAELRQVLLHKDGADREPIAELLLYLADRYQHLKEVIEPALRRGCHVICDRYHDATLAYQGYARGIGFETVDRLAEILQLPTPNLTVVLDVDVLLGLSRACRRNEQENQEEMGRFEEENPAFHEKVRQGYRLLSEREPDRVVLVDGSGSPEGVFRRVLDCLERHGIFRI